MRGSRRATGAPRREACEAPPIRHGLRRDTFPSGEGGWVGRARAGLPYGRPASREGCALRLSRERRRPPAEADGGYSCSSGHAPLRRTAPFLTCSSTPADKPRNARQAHHPAPNEGGPPVPPGRQRTTGITLQGVPSRPREEANSLAQREVSPQTKRRGVRGQPWCCLGLAATGRPLVLSREWERTPFMPAPRAKEQPRHPVQPKAH